MIVIARETHRAPHRTGSRGIVVERRKNRVYVETGIFEALLNAYCVAACTSRRACTRIDRVDRVFTEQTYVLYAVAEWKVSLLVFKKHKALGAYLFVELLCRIQRVLPAVVIGSILANFRIFSCASHVSRRRADHHRSRQNSADGNRGERFAFVERPCFVHNFLL